MNAVTHVGHKLTVSNGRNGGEYFMARRWRGTIMAVSGVVPFTLLAYASSSPNWDDVQPWVTVAGVLTFLGGAMAVFDSWSAALKKPEKPTDEERRNW